jgi:hypothetical protein
MLALIIFLCANTAIFLINKGGEVIKVSKIRNGEIPFVTIGNYVQICSPITTQYNKVYRKAIKSLQTKDDIKFRESIFRMNTIFNKFKVNLNNPPLRNPDSAYLSAIKHSQIRGFNYIGGAI